MAASVSLLSSTPPSPTPRLPDGWSAPEAVEDVVAAEGLSIRRAGVASIAPDGEEVTGSAAELEHLRSAIAEPAESVAPGERAWFELLERLSIVEAMRSRADRHTLRNRAGAPVRTCDHREVFPESDDPAAWRHARSSGVALHRDWNRACDRALWELAERDRVLASWQGHVRPERIEGAPPSLGLATPSYEWSAYVFPEHRSSGFSRGLEVAGVFGFPREPGLPLALGFAARPERRAAIRDATREAIQILGFLWGETVAPPAANLDPTAIGHLDFYQPCERHPLLRSWLAGEHVAFAHADPFRGAASPHAVRDDVEFVDLTPPWLTDLRIVKALCASARPLVFGAGPGHAHLPADRRIHPIA